MNCFSKREKEREIESVSVSLEPSPNARFVKSLDLWVVRLEQKMRKHNSESTVIVSRRRRDSWENEWPATDSCRASDTSYHLVGLF